MEMATILNNLLEQQSPAALAMAQEVAEPEIPAHEAAEAGLVAAIMDVRRNAHTIAADPVALALLQDDLKALTRTVRDITEISQGKTAA